MKTSFDILLDLVRIALCDYPTMEFAPDTDWPEVKRLAMKMEVPAIALDGLQACLEAYPEIETDTLRITKIEWFKSVISLEVMNDSVAEAAKLISGLYSANGIEKTWVLKGLAYSRRYPVPRHRMISDLDFYVGKDYEKANRLIESKGIRVDRSQYKHSQFRIKKSGVENHQFFTAIRGNSRNKQIERKLRDVIDGPDSIEMNGIKGLYLPSWEFDALFFMYHSRAHLLTVDGISLRFVTDWMILRRNASSSCLDSFRKECVELGFEKYYNVIDELADCIEKGTPDCDLSASARYLLDSMSSRRIRKHEGAVRTYLDMIWRFLSEGRKFRLFSDISSARMIWTYITGFIFDRHPEC